MRAHTVAWKAIRAPIRTNIVGSSVTQSILVVASSCIDNYSGNARERELATHSIVKRRGVGIVNPIRARQWRHAPGRRRNHTYMWPMHVQETLWRVRLECDKNDSNKNGKWKGSSFRDEKQPCYVRFSSFKRRWIPWKPKSGFVRWNKLVEALSPRVPGSYVFRSPVDTKKI